MYKILSNPLASTIVARLRDKNTPPQDFRYFLFKLGRFLIYEAVTSIDVKSEQVTTPLGVATYNKLADQITVVGILRAALPMIDGVVEELPASHIGLISASRGKMLDENGKNFEILTNYSKIPPIENHIVFLVDPMLASASTLLSAMAEIKANKPKKVIILCAIAAKFGIQRLEKAFPDIEIYAGAVDDILNDHGYIVPGLGDAGDRAFNTL